MREELNVHLEHRELNVLVGPRQAAKATLLKLLESGLRIHGAKSLFFNLDIDKNVEDSVAQERLSNN